MNLILKLIMISRFSENFKHFISNFKVYMAKKLYSNYHNNYLMKIT